MAQQCKAKAKSTGKRCARYSIEGGTVCRAHGGASKQAKSAAKRRQVEAKAAETMRLLAAPVDIDPATALLELVQWTAGEVRYWRAEVNRISENTPDMLTWGRAKAERGVGPQGPVDTETHEAVPPVAYRMLESAQDRLAKYAAAALRAGVEERRVKLAEDQGSAVAGAIRRILERLDLLEWQAELVPTIVPEELRALTAGV